MKSIRFFLSLIVIVLFIGILTGCTQKVVAPSDTSKDNILKDDIITNTEVKDIVEVDEIEGVDSSSGVTEDSTDILEIDYDINLGYFENRDAGISLQYPENVSMDDDAKLKLTVDITPIDELDGTMGYDVETANSNIKSLSNGDYGIDVDFPFINSKKVIKVGDSNINAQDFIVFGRFEICSVVFERKLYLFHNGYQIVVTLSLPKEEIINNYPQYFTTNDINCGEDSIWDTDGQNRLYEDLLSGKDIGAISEWFSAFDKIVNNIFLIEDMGEDTITQIANPASVFCEDNGGELEILTDENGEYGLCHFDDGSSCEEWSFFRGECKKGEKK